MNRTLGKTTTAAILLLISTGSAQAQELTNSAAAPSSGPPNVIVAWNDILQALIRPGPSNAQRLYAILHVAIFDAINSVEDRYKPYRIRVRGGHGASPEAAVAQAGHDVLMALFPTQQGIFDDALAAQLAGLPPAPARQGRRVGRRVAKAILAWRQDDGWAAPLPAYVLPLFPGLWQPTPPAFSVALFTQYPNVVPFALLTSTQYLPPPPPPLTSERYAADFNEVKSLGSVTSTTRTEEETLLARLFAGVVTPIESVSLWNIIAGDVAAARGLSLVDTARLFALVNVSIHDGLQTSFTSKFVYGLWRPVTAIRRADEDQNDLTEPEPEWTPLLATPPYPSYAGNAACRSAAAARALALGLGRDDIPFTINWPGTPPNPDVTREFDSFSQLAEVQARSRIHGGIHYQFDSDASQVACPKVAEYVFANFMRPRHHGSHDNDDSER
jgi:hypothetical protein